MSNPQVLLVEDEAIVAKNVGLELQSMGYAVCGVASRGEDAIRMAVESRPDLVLMDIVLDGDLDGIETTKKLREKLDVPVVYLTAYADEEILERAKETEPFGYLLKPYEERELHTTIQMALRKHEMEKALKHLQQWLDSTLRSMADGVMVTDVNGRICLLNPAAEKLTGWGLDEARGREWSEVLRLVERDSRAAKDNLATLAAGTGTVSLGEGTVLLAKDGSERLLEGTLSDIQEVQGSVGGWVILFRDVTERIHAEEALRQCELQLRRGEGLESLDRATSGLAHEFGNWLTGVLVNISAAMTDLPEDHPSRKHLSKAEKLALRAGEMVNQLVKFSRRKKRPLEPADLNKIVWEVVEVLCCLMDTRIAVLFTPQKDVWPVLGDPGLLKELVFSLCLNSRDELVGRGELMLQTENVEREEIARLKTTPPRRGEFVCLRVCDTGEGTLAAAWSRGRKGEPARQEENGTGWSLTLVSAIIEQHGGWIDYHSEPGQGTRFEIYLPRHGSDQE